MRDILNVLFFFVFKTVHVAEYSAGLINASLSYIYFVKYRRGEISILLCVTEVGGLWI